MSGLALRPSAVTSIERRSSPPLVSNGNTDGGEGVSDPHLARHSSPHARFTGVAHACVNVFVLNRCVPGDVAAGTAERAPVLCQVRMVNELPLIPDLERLEEMIADETTVTVA